MKRILSILLENESGSLSRVIGLFSQRGYNIESLTVSTTEDPSLSQLTIQTVGDEKILEQIGKQLHKLIDVLKVSEINTIDCIEREIILIKTGNICKKKRRIKDIVDIFEGKIISLTTKGYIIQITGSSKKINAFLELIKKYINILDLSRSGIIRINRN
ncbi:acetolactate synthase small subunit [Buchnera aphidicola (Mindarus keteleerifoliae)]|uniref:acetolactate synthase small subunit n=1 Tax=Buchnera aphidicola TaxID=9 RepID=UPI0031B67A64